MTPLIIIGTCALVFTVVAKVRSQMIEPHDTDKNKSIITSTLKWPEKHGTTGGVIQDTVPKGKEYLVPYISEDRKVDVKIVHNGEKEQVIVQDSKEKHSYKKK